MQKAATLISLGCAKNLVDSEAMIPQLMALGYSMTSDASAASLIVVNTCGFLESAVQEAIDSILETARLKTSGRCRHLVVTGCMVQRYGKKLIDLLPEVDLFLGTSHYHELAEALISLENGGGRKLRISAATHLQAGETERVRSTSPGSAYLKIAEGCSNRCTFCLIPQLRGPYRSRATADIVKEASRLARDGVKELNLIAQDTTAFGSDRGEPYALLSLLEALDTVEGIEWIRLLYVYPDRVSPELLRTMAQSEKIVSYLDIPFQHCSPGILSRMRRSGNASNVEGVIDLIRTHVPEMVLRTSLMVGFPGETEEDYLALIAFVERARFDHVGVFAFSPEEGSRAAKMVNQVDSRTKERRRKGLMKIQRRISRKLLKRLVGKTLPVLIEGFHPETDLLLVGRLPVQAPEVDGTVIITSGTGQVGNILPARITAAHDYDVEAQLDVSDE